MLVHDVSQATLSNLYGRLEATYYKVHRFCRVSDVPIRISSCKLEVLLFDRWSDYVRWAQRSGIDPSGTYGYYCQQSNRSVFFNVEHDPEVVRLRGQIDAGKANLERFQDVLANLPPDVDRVRIRYPDGRAATLTLPEAHDELADNQKNLHRLEIKLKRYYEQLNQSVIQHEAAHHILFAGGVHPRSTPSPLWLVEGLAMQFESPLDSRNQEPTTISPYRLEEFRRAHKNGQLRPLPEVLWGHEEIVGNVTNRAIYYAQAWALVYYLKKKQPDRFAAYVRALAARRPGVPIAADRERTDFCRFFGPPDDAFAKRWEKYILTLPYRSSEVGF